MDAFGVHVVVLPDDGDLGAQILLVNVTGSSGALVGVHEAHLEHVILALGGSLGRGRGGQGKDPVRIVLHGGGFAGLGGDGAQGELHAPVLQGVVGIDGLFGVVHVVLIAQLELDVAAQGVDLIHSQLCAVLGCHAVDGGIPGQRASATNLEGSASGGAGGSIVGAGIGGAAVIGAAGAQAQGHCGGQGHAK